MEFCRIAPDVKLGKGVQYYAFVNLYGCSIGDNTRIGTFVEIQKNARIGNNVKISSHTFICEGVQIEDDVFIGHNVSFINDKYPRATNGNGALQTQADWSVVPTLVKQGASIGTSATVLCGVMVGRNAIVGAGSVVTRDVPDGAVVAGNPARIIRKAGVMKVPFVNLYAQHAPIEPKLIAAFERVLASNSFVLGPEVEAFEREFAAYLGAGQCVTVNSGTSALQLALQALGIGPGDEVITVANTFIATAEAISAVGARPVFVEVDPEYFTIDVNSVEAAITGKTRALIPVHLFGQPADMDLLMETARRHGLKVIEDACQAHGAEYNGRKVGTIGDVGCFSFYPGKNLGALGEGGAAVTNDPEIAKRIRMLRDHGSLKKYQHSFPGYNFRLEGLQAAFLKEKLPLLDEANERRQRAAELYGELLTDSGVIIPAVMPGAKHVYHLYVIQVPNRDGLKSFLADRGIETGLHYPVPLHLQEAYRDLGYQGGAFPVTEALAGKILSLPMHPNITKQEIEYVCSAIKDFVQCPKTVAQAA